MVSDKRLSHVSNLYHYRDIKTFISDIDFLVSTFRPIHLQDLLASVRGLGPLPENAVLLTFDDGFREMYDIVAPILSERKISATFFLTKNLIDNMELQWGNKKSLLIDRLQGEIHGSSAKEVYNLLIQRQVYGESISEKILSIPYKRRALIDDVASLLKIDFGAYLSEQKPYLSSSEITRLLESGFTIGGHSIDHPRFSELTLEEQLEQSIASIDHLVEAFQIDYKAFAFPFTDQGISKAYYKAILPHAEITFGTMGLLADSIPTNFQRVSVEKSRQSAKRTLKFHYARRILYQMRKKHIIIRN